MAVYEEIYRGLADKAARSMDKFIELLRTMLEDRKRQIKYHDEGDEGIQAILRHLKKGGEVRMQDVPREYAPMFEAIVKSQGVPYFKIESGEGDGRRCVFITRNKDSKLMEDVWGKFHTELNIGMSEYPASEFINMTQGQDIRRSIGYDEVEVEVFRRKMAERNGAYAVIESDSESGKFDIMYMPRDHEEVDNAFRDMQYELSGDKGHIYKNTLSSDITERKAFEDRISPKRGETLYIVDSKNPNNFISVTATGFAVHSLKASEEILKNGRKQEIITDTNVIQSNIFDKDRILHFAEGLTKPVVLSQKEMSLVTGIAPDGSAIVAKHDNFKNFYEDFRKELSSRDDLYNGLSVRKMERIGRTYTLMNIPNNKMSEIYEAFRGAGLESRTAVVGDSVAYTESDKAIVTELLNGILYDGMTSLEMAESRLYYEGHGNIELQKPAITKYLISARDPEFVIRIKPEGMDIFKNGAVANEIAREDEQYEPLLIKLISSMKEPVVLSEEEIATSKEEKTDIINSRRSINQRSEALNYLQDVENNKKAEIHGIEHESEAKHLDSRQQEAVRSHLRHETVDTFVDRTFTEKIMDMDISKKLRQDFHTREMGSHTAER